MTSFVPLYKRIQELIRADYLAAPAREPARLPTERSLQARYGVSRPTISKALTSLEAEGLLTKAQGRGIFLVPLVSHAAPVRQSETPSLRQSVRKSNGGSS
jgi:GntR family transcriptional regulator